MCHCQNKKSHSGLEFSYTYVLTSSAKSFFGNINNLKLFRNDSNLVVTLWPYIYTKFTDGVVQSEVHLKINHMMFKYRLFSGLNLL